MTDAAIEAAAMAIARAAIIGEYEDVPIEEIFPTPRARYVFLHERYMTAARAAIAAYEAACWNSKETAPTDETPVLVWDGRAVSEDIYAPSVRGRRGAKEGHRISVTLWRHMPTPPGGER